MSSMETLPKRPTESKPILQLTNIKHSKFNCTILIDFYSNFSIAPLMHLILVILWILDMHLHRSSNQPHFPDDDVLLALDPCSSFGLSFVDFGWIFFLLYYITSISHRRRDFFCRQNKIDWYGTNCTYTQNTHDSLKNPHRNKVHHNADHGGIKKKMLFTTINKW